MGSGRSRTSRTSSRRNSTARTSTPTSRNYSSILPTEEWSKMSAAVANPLLLIAELSYKCPLHCPYCSNPLTIGDAKYSDELPTEDWLRVLREAAELGVLQLALTGGEPLVRKDCEEFVAVAKEVGLYSNLIT